MTDKPLHVHVAEALGWTWKKSSSNSVRFLCPPAYLEDFDLDPTDYFDADDSVRVASDAFRYVPRYDTDWAATGPLIEKYGIELEWEKRNNERMWSAAYGWQVGRLRPVLLDGYASTPLLAVCHLLLQLHKAGKLTPSV